MAAAAKQKEEAAAASKRNRSDNEAASETPTTETGEPVEKKRRGMNLIYCNCEACSQRQERRPYIF